MEALVHRVVIGEDSSIGVAEGDHDCAGQRCRVHQMSAAELARVEQTVGQDEASFGVGVDDLNAFARHGNLHVAGLLRFAGGHVLGGAHDADHLHFRLQQRDGAHGPDHGGAARHVVFHLLHAVGGLDRDAPGVESNSFADKA